MSTHSGGSGAKNGKLTRQHRSESKQAQGTIGLSPVPGTKHFELVHPRCVLKQRAEYQQGIESFQAGQIEEALSILRGALQSCRDNLWVHVALGQIAIEAREDPQLARGHYGYAFELVERTLPKKFSGYLLRSLPGNKPYFEAAEGLAACYEALNRPKDAVKIRSQAERIGGP